MKKESSILIGGKAGFGIDTAGSLIAKILAKLGYRIYVYRDYPSLIRGGHTFSIIRASEAHVASIREKVNYLLALNEDCLQLHQQKLTPDTVIIYDSGSVKAQGLGFDIGVIVKDEGGSEIMRNSCIIGGFAKAAGISWEIVEEIFRKNISKEEELNIKVAKRGYEALPAKQKITPLHAKPLPVLTGAEAISLGFIQGGLKSYIAYPMTPSSPVLHIMAKLADEFGLKVIHPESEISVMLMAQGASYVGEKVAVGTSGGGFCLMTEGLSFCGMAELPIVILLGQRPGPSTGLPTYSSQTELSFAINAGQGEFLRLIVSPGDLQEAYFWSALSLNLAWKYQIPVFVLSEKDLIEGAYSFNESLLKEIKEETPKLWENTGSAYKRYEISESGVSALAFPPQENNIIKINSYEHDELGITTEDPIITKKMQDKRLGKEELLVQDLKDYDTVNTYGDKTSSKGVICWGGNKGICIEVAKDLGLRLIHPVVLWPLPVERLKNSLKGVKKLVCVENNATGQLAALLVRYGIQVDEKILKYDGRPFTVEELTEKLKEAF